MEHKLAIRTEQWHCAMTDFVPTYIPEYQVIHISLLLQPQERREKSGSTFIEMGASTWAKTYCVTHSSVTSNLQVVNAVQRRICAGTSVYAWSFGGGSAVTVYCTWKHIHASAAEPPLFLSELCSACVDDDKQDHTQHSLHGQVTTAHSIKPTVPPTHPAPYLSSPVHRHNATVQSMREDTGGTWPKVNVCREERVHTCKDMEG